MDTLLKAQALAVYLSETCGYESGSTVKEWST